MNKYRRWTEKEDEVLITQYDKKTNKELALFFNRALSKISRRAKRLGIVKDKNISNKAISNSLKNKYKKGILSQKGEKNSRWNGGRRKDYLGYIHLWKPGHQNANSKGYVREHIFIMSQKLGRPLLKTEIIHHINHIRDDNRIENLILLKSHAEHRYLHVEETKRKRT